MPSYLLDKNVVRFLLTALVRGTTASREEELAVFFWGVAVRQDWSLYISLSTAHVLQRREPDPVVSHFLSHVSVLRPSRYHARWSRRLREYGFSREDAAILALCTFGTNPARDILGVSTLVTMDVPLLNNLHQHHATLLARLAAMTKSLRTPYCFAVLPSAKHPLELLRA